MRRTLDQWFSAVEIRPEIVAEFESATLMKLCADGADAVFAAPSIIEDDLRKRYGAVLTGLIDNAEERFYIISTQRQMKHPAAVAIAHSAHRNLFFNAASAMEDKAAAAASQRS